jgi:UDP-N-acetylmuramoyl-tripeptide--D-alanyl-D-alanine ligase
VIAEVLVAEWTAGEVARRLGGTLTGDPAARFAAATTDSRESREGVAFFALDGARQRGMQFVPAAFGSGCSVVVVPEDWSGEVPDGRAAVRVEDPHAALVELARQARAGWHCPVLAVTGSVGKTTVKEMVAAALAGAGEVLRTPGNFNTSVGVARTLLSPRESPDLAVLEVGASAPGEIARLAALVRPTAAAVVNVSPAHLEGFGTVDNVRREKCALLAGVEGDGPRLVDGDDAELLEVAAAAGELVRIGLEPGNDWTAVDVALDATGRASFLVRDVRVALGVPGRHQVKNALFALALADAHGVSLTEAAGRLATFRGVAGRLAVTRRGGVTVVDDSYNASPRSMQVALDWLAAHAAAGRRAAVLGDMLELGEDSERLHGEVGRRVAGMGLDLVLFVGPESRAAWAEAKEGAGDRALHVADADEAARLLREWVHAGDTVLVKASRGVHLERIVSALGPADDAADDEEA